MDIKKSVASTMRLACLLAIGARLADMTEGEALSLGQVALGLPLPPGAILGGRSELNNDGDPLQICVSSSASAVRVRLIADPRWCQGRAQERLTASRTALSGVLRLQPSGLGPLCDRLLQIAIPQDAEGIARFRRGFCWIGAGLGTNWLGLYVDAKPRGPAGWEVAREWLCSELPDSRPATAFLDSLAEYGELASLALEGSAPDRASLKLYWRLRRPMALSKSYNQLFQDPAFKFFLARTIGARSMRLSGTVFSVGFDAGSGAIAGAKIDLCGHCLPQEPDQWQETLDALSQGIGLKRMPVSGDLLAGRCDVAFLGLGVNAQRQARLNLYLKTPGLKSLRLATPACARQGAKERLVRAINYLADLQRTDGSWGDYFLPVGEATQWVTAFAGLALASAARQAFHEALGPAQRAADWLASARTYPAGWGYNGTTGIDADSTGLALRLFRSLGREVRPEDEQCLLGQWRPGGGFATYNGPGYWAAVHPCVTSVAFLGLSATARLCLLRDLLGYLSRTIRQDGTWPAYWWRNHLYSTFHHRFLLRQLNISEQYPDPSVQATPTDEASPFELAYAVGIEYLRRRPGQYKGELLHRLLDVQKQDGSWEGGFNLRVTEPDCARPWDDPRGTLYADEYSTITTASAITALLEVTRG
jgi:hypothetical protein